MFRYLTLLCTISSALLAQSESGRAVLEGKIFDQSGKTIASAAITVVSTQTGATRTTTTGEDCKFRISALPVGTYDLQAAASSFGVSKAEGILLTVGETKSVSISLAVSSVSTQMTVEAVASVVNPAKSS